MILILCFIFLFIQQLFPQKDSLDIYSPFNIKKFADFLYCSQDYLRAAEEYKKYLTSNFNDTVEFKTGLAYSMIGNFNKAGEWFNNIEHNSKLYLSARQEYFKSLFQLGNYHDFRKAYRDTISKKIKLPDAAKLYYFSFFFTEDELPAENDFIKDFSPEEKGDVENLYKRKINPEYKSTAAAVILSSVIPGSGKIYAGQIADGIIAAISTSLCAFLAYDNFKANHNFRGWLFSGLSLFFYAGNIYGSAAAVQIFNASISFNFKNDVQLFLNRQNYFSQHYDFCK